MLLTVSIGLITTFAFCLLIKQIRFTFVQQCDSKTTAYSGDSRQQAYMVLDMQIRILKIRLYAYSTTLHSTKDYNCESSSKKCFGYHSDLE